MAQGLIEEQIAALNARDMASVLGGFRSDVEWVAPGGVLLHGPAQVESFLLAWWQAFPDASYELGAHFFIFGGAVAALEAVLTGTHKGMLYTTHGDIPATGKPVRVPYAAIVRLEGGRIKSEHLYFDLVQLLTELDGRGELMGRKAMGTSKSKQGAVGGRRPDAGEIAERRQAVVTRAAI